MVFAALITASLLLSRLVRAESSRWRVLPARCYNSSVFSAFVHLIATFSGRKVLRLLRAGIGIGAAIVLAVLLPATLRAPRAEVIEEIVAWVNDDIITRTDLEGREREASQDLYAKFSGDDLSRHLAETRSGVLRDMISERLLLQQAERLYDMKKMQDSLMKNFKEQQKVSSDEELNGLLKDEGMTIEDLRRRLMEYNAPRSVIEYEVKDKVAITDAEVEAWYREHGGELSSADEVTFREIVILSEGRGADTALTEAVAIVEQARSGADFAKLAAEKSEAVSRERGGLLGPFHRGELHPDIEKAAFSLPPGQISEPIVSPHGVHVIRVESRVDAKLPPLEDVREKISDRLEDERFRRNLSSYMRKIWSGADIEVSRGYLDRISPDYKDFVKPAVEKALR